jgi:ABC-type oligopeptide transport system substrate-binding subunit
MGDFIKQQRIFYIPFIYEGGKKMQGKKKSLSGLLLSLFSILAMLLSACDSNAPPKQTFDCSGNMPTKQASTNNANISSIQRLAYNANTPSKQPFTYDAHILQTQNAEKAPDSQQVFRYPTEVVADFGTLDPALVQSLSDSYAMQLIFTGLVQFDNNGNVKDQLAQSHEVSADGLTYTFHLRPNLKFSDGTPLTANDVAYSINRTLLPATKSQVTSYLKLIKGYTDIISGKVPTLIGSSLIVKDDNTLSIIINKPAAYFLETLTYPTAYVVEKSLIDKYGTTWTDHLTEGGGNGPFKVKNYEHGKTFNVVPNPNYYGLQPALAEIDLPFSGDNETTYKAYKNQQYDWVAIPAADLPEAQTRPDFYRVPTLVERYIAFNFLAKPFNNREIRQAFALAINKELIANNVAHGAVTATNNIVPNGMYGHNPTLKGPDGTTKLTGDQTKAKALLTKGLQEENYSSVSSLPTLTLTTYTGNTTVMNVANNVVQQWKNVLGINVKVNAIDANELNRQQIATTGNDNLQMWFYGWQADYPDPQDWLSVFFGKGQDYNNNNYGCKSNQRASEEQAVQDKLASADAEQDSTKRASLYNAAEQQIVNDVAWVPLYQSDALIAQNPKLHGYKTNALQITDPDSWSDVYFTT